MRTAYCIVGSGPAYRRESFVAGLERLSLRVRTTVSQSPAPSDILLIWNRHGHFDDIARRFASVGATVIVAENGYIGTDQNGWRLYALARDHHNGPGHWPVGDGDRWSGLGIELKPWRWQGRHVLVLPQRGIGEPGVAMPRDWTSGIVSRLQHSTDRPIKVRSHPGRERPPLEPDLIGCWAAVTWGSGAAIKAIVAGIPVFHELDGWIGAPAARFGIGDIESPFLGDRMPMLHRLSFAQWSIDEIAGGDPLRRLIAT